VATRRTPVVEPGRLDDLEMAWRWAKCDHIRARIHGTFRRSARAEAALGKLPEGEAAWVAAFAAGEVDEPGPLAPLFPSPSRRRW